MNRLAAALAQVCRELPLAEKRLLAPDRRAGQQWVRQAVRGGQPAINVIVTPLKALAFALAGPRFLKEKATLLPALGRRLVVEQIWREWRLENPDRYLSRLPPSAGMAEALARSLHALRMASVAPEDLTFEQFEAPEKGRDLAELLARYLHRLRRQKWRDDADLFRAAADRILAARTALGPQTWFLIPADLRFVGLAQELLDQLPEERRRPLPVDEPEQTEPNAAVTDLVRLRFLKKPAAAPPVVGDGSVRFVRALGEANEVKALFRTLLAEGIPLDQTEVLHTDPETYLPLLRQTPAAAGPAGQGLPINFSEGLPTGLSRPGRALAAWLRWIDEDYPQPAFAALLQEGLLRTGEEAPSAAHAADLAEALLELEIYRERGRWFEAFESLPSAPPSRTPGRGLDLPRLHELWRTLKPLMELLPTHPQPGDWLRAAEQFLLRFAVGADEFDNLSRDKLRHDIEEQLEWLERTEGLAAFAAFSWLEQLPRNVHALGQGPLPGTLHVAPLQNGGHSGRPYTFILGLDDGRLAGHVPQDPLLLDKERSRIAPELPTSGQQAEEQERARLRLIARLRGKVTLSHSVQNVAEDTERFASPFWQSAWQLLHGTKEPPKPISFLPSAPAEALSVSERWLQALHAIPHPVNAATLLGRYFPDRAQGRLAEAARASTRFTEYDGRVPELKPRHDPTHADGPALSAHTLETLGSCPLRYFFSEALGAKAPRSRELEAEDWFPRDVQGQLLHAVFQQYHAELKSAGLQPDFARDAEKLTELLRRESQLQRRRQPQPRPEVEETEWRQLEQIVGLFLHEAAKQGPGVQPLWFEASLGLGEEPATPLDVAEPIRVPLGDGLFLRLRGRIDRIDRLGGEAGRQYVVWDYKTGGLDRFEGSEEKPFQGGRLLQPLVYLLMAEARLKETVGADAEVEAVGYLFPGRGGEGDRLRWSAAALAPGRLKLRLLAELARRGFFPPTEAADDCQWCDYSRVCSVPEVNASAKGMQDETANADLEPLRRLRAADEPEPSQPAPAARSGKPRGPARPKRP